VGVALLGSGGSIGTQAVDVLAALAPDWRVVALATGSQAALLEEAGIATLATNADAARCAAMLVHPPLQAEWMREMA